MNVLKILFTVTMVIFLPWSAQGQMTDEAEVKEISQQYDLGLSKTPSIPLLDLSRLHLNHSYSMSFFSGGGQSGSQALYNGTMTYQLANPLTLTLNLGILHKPGDLFGQKSFDNSAAFLPSGWLDWRPSQNFRMTIGFETVPAYYRGYHNSGRYWHWR